ncbi:MAG TPA: hypothetical protein VN764_17280, partial [Polyangiaceae bacterium]|nr:hypothetical protein [Polyangiaceae bacterium]
STLAPAYNDHAPMNGVPETINSIEWAVLFAALVLTTRLYSLIRATLGVQTVQREVLDALAAQDPGAVERRTRDLRYLSPYADIARDLVHAAQKDQLGGIDHPPGDHGAVERTRQAATRRFRRRTRQGSIADVLTLWIGAIVVIYSRNLLLEGPLFWSCSGAMFVTLVATFTTRRWLLTQVLTNTETLVKTLSNRPQLPSLSEGALPCLWCGNATQRLNYELVDEQGVSTPISATLCDDCGKLVTTLPRSSPPSSR